MLDTAAAIELLDEQLLFIFIVGAVVVAPNIYRFCCCCICVSVCECA